MTNNFIKNLQNVVTEIKEKVTMYDIFNDYDVEVTGNKTLCIFHEETNPSLSVYNEDKNFKCFSCGASGDIITYVMKQENVEYIEAIKIIANKYNINIEYENMTEEEKERIENNTKLNRLRELWKDKYIEQFWSEEGENAREYLINDRGLTENILRKFEIGLALDNDTEVEFIKEKAKELNINQEVLKEEKILSNGYAGLSNYIILPIISKKKTIGFQGMLTKKERNGNRSCEEEAYRPKYKTFSNVLVWNLDSNKSEEVNVTEGIIDALTMIQTGYSNTIAVLGVNQLDDEKYRNKLFDKNKKVNFFFDNDEAGNGKAIKYAQLMKSKAGIIKVEYNVTDKVKKLEDKVEELLESLQEMDSGNEVLQDKLNTTYKDKINKVIKDSKDINGIFGLLDFNEIEFKKFIDKILQERKSILDLQVIEWDKEQDYEIKAEKFEEMIKVAYEYFEGNAVKIDGFKQMLKNNHKVKTTIVDTVIKELKNKKNEIQEIPYGQGIEIPEWEEFSGVLYKNRFVGVNEEGLPDYIMQEVTRTIPMIDSILINKLKNREEVLIKFTDRFDNEKEVIVKREDLLTEQAIIRELGKYGMNITQKNAKDIIEYLQFIENERTEEIKLRELIETTGYVNDTTFIGRRGEIITKDGIVPEEDSKIVYKNLDEDRTVKKVKDIISEEEWKELISEVFPKLILLNEKKVSVSIISWFLTSIIKEKMQELYKTKAFPLMNIYGVQGSGKTTIATMMQKMLGGTDEVKSAKGTIFPLMKSMTLSNSFPLIIDEYKISDLGEIKNNSIMNMLKIAYNSNIEMRGNADKTIEEYHLTTPVVLIGENAVTGDSSDAVKERTAIISLSKTWLERNKENTFSIVNELNRKDLGNFYIRYIMFMQEMIETGRLEELYQVAEQRAEEFYKINKNILTDRHFITLINLSMGTELLRELYKIADIEFDITEKDIEDMFNHSLRHALNEEEKENSLDRIMLYFAETLIKDFDDTELYLDTQEKLLYIKKTRLLTLLDNHSRQNKFEKIDKSSVTQYMEENMKADGYINNLGKDKKINKKKQYCIVVDMEKLEKATRINEDTFIDYSDEIELNF